MNPPQHPPPIPPPIPAPVAPLEAPPSPPPANTFLGLYWWAWVAIVGGAALLIFAAVMVIVQVRSAAQRAVARNNALQAQIAQAMAQQQQQQRQAMRRVTTPPKPVTRPRPNPPPSFRKTALVGGNGGGPFQFFSPAGQTVVGFRYQLGTWMNQGIVQSIEPVFPSDSPPATRPIIRAKPGYVVGGLIVDGTQYANAFRVIFVRERDGQIDSTDTYTSDWIGTPQGQKQTQLAGNGERVLGIHGRKGLNVDALGLLLAP